MNMITLTIDGVSVTVPAGTTVLEAARAAGIEIPTLCYLKDINEIGACRLCVVDTGARAAGRLRFARHRGYESENQYPGGARRPQN